MHDTMNRNEFKHAVTKHAATMLLAAIFVLAALTMTACSPNQDAETKDEGATPISYISQVNDSSANLSETLGEFAQAVSAGDVFSMQAKADAAYAIIDEMRNIEAPEELNEVKSKYNDATDKLKGALSDYVALYVELKDAADGKAFDYGAYPSRIENIQKQYDEGLNLLEEADSMAAEK